MRRFLNKIFGSGSQRRDQTRRKMRLEVEQLTQRILPSAGMVHMDHESDHVEMAESSGEHVNSESESGHSESHDHSHISSATFVANLTNGAGATGKASFNATNNALSVRVHDASTSTTLNVQVDGTMVGTLTTNDDGNGRVTLPNVTVKAGSMIMVGNLTGTFTQVLFSASLSGSSGATGNASFSTIKDRLNLSISGAATNTTYDVLVNGVVLGQLKTNDSGAGHFRQSNPSVTIEAGSTISVQDTLGNPSILQGTFA